jgi:hypothetical protein
MLVLAIAAASLLPSWMKAGLHATAALHLGCHVFAFTVLGLVLLREPRIAWTFAARALGAIALGCLTELAEARCRLVWIEVPDVLCNAAGVMLGAGLVCGVAGLQALMRREPVGRAVPDALLNAR